MNMETLYELKKQYELELVKAEAKVAVITDIISANEPPSEYEQTETSEATDETSIPNY